MADMEFTRPDGTPMDIYDAYNLGHATGYIEGFNDACLELKKTLDADGFVKNIIDIREEADNG